MSTLESQLETAYAKVARQYEPLLAQDRISLRLATSILNQSPRPVDGESEESEQIPAPYVLLKALRTDESTPDPTIFAVELQIEAGDNVESAGEDAFLDSLFRAAARPLFYTSLTDNSTSTPVTYAGRQALSQALSRAIPAFNCIALKERAGGTAMENEGSIVKRGINATFFCQTTALAA